MKPTLTAHLSPNLLLTLASGGGSLPSSGGSWLAVEAAPGDVQAGVSSSLVRLREVVDTTLPGGEVGTSEVVGGSSWLCRRSTSIERCSRMARGRVLPSLTATMPLRICSKDQTTQLRSRQKLDFIVAIGNNYSGRYYKIAVGFIYFKL